MHLLPMIESESIHDLMAMAMTLIIYEYSVIAFAIFKYEVINSITFHRKTIHSVTRKSQVELTTKQIDWYVLIQKRFRLWTTDARSLRGSGCNIDYFLIIAILRINLISYKKLKEKGKSQSRHTKDSTVRLGTQRKYQWTEKKVQ